MDYLELNQIAQGVVAVETALVTFRALAPEDRARIIQRLSLMVHQAHPTPIEIADAITAGGLKPTFTPCVMLTKSNRNLTAIARLPDGELEKAFVLLIHVFCLADGRRRKSCGEECHHWWHQDLSDESVVRSLAERDV